jgi:MarR family transcriptional regulator, organic hydroperoxide resistance regulator
VLQTREEIEHEVVTQYPTLVGALKASSGTIWREIDLTVAQLRTLLVLAEEGPLVIRQIAQRMGVGLSTGGHLVDRLVQAGLAERTEDAEDRRRTLARLTPKGEDLYARLLNPSLLMQTLIQRLEDADLAALSQGLQALNRLVDIEPKADCSL